MIFIILSRLILGSSIYATTPSITSPKLCGGIFVATPTAIPEVPFTSKFGKRPGITSGSLSVSSKLSPQRIVSFSRSRKSSIASGVILASV